MSSPAPTTFSPAPFALRTLRGVLLLGLSLVLTILLGLALFSSSSLLVDAIRPLFEWNTAESRVAGWLTLAFIVIVPLLLVLLAWRLRLRSWWWVAGGYLAVAPVVVYLAVDDPAILHAVSIEEIAPAFPGAEKSYAVLMRYSKSPAGLSAEATAFAQKKLRLVGLPVKPDQPAEWNAFLVKNRAAIEADWSDLAPQRLWLAEVNAFDRLGDLGAGYTDQVIITFQVWQTLTHRTLHVAGLHVLDGQPDAAISTLLPLLQAGRKLQPSARSLVRMMTGIFVEKNLLLYAKAIVDHSAVSATTRAQLAASLGGGVRGEAGARRVVGLEYSLQMTASLDHPLGELLYLPVDGQSREVFGRLLNAVSPLLYNPRRSINAMNDLTRELQDLAAHRDPMTGGRADSLFVTQTKPHFKNFAGPLVVARTVPAYARIISSYWELHDRRDELQKILNRS
jgi:hypothetical protein